ncbi:hypothetical protein GE061_020303 [Apolygus lucorum]|uniref:Uncharacterized protein n=1 Tax=Apolygus lucorum TaxID=248454 RepID=A0A8S9WLY4_APOLU|nr:hypothetical protein GE061_020303 [Apolygus lucorum]
MELFWAVAAVVSLVSSGALGFVTLDKDSYFEATGLKDLVKIRNYRSLLDYLEKSDEAYFSVIMELSSAWALAIPKEIAFLRRPIIDAANTLENGKDDYIRCLHTLKASPKSTKKIRPKERKFWKTVTEVGFEMYQEHGVVEKKVNPDVFPLLKYNQFPTPSPEESFAFFHYQIVDLLENMVLNVKNTRSYILKTSKILGAKCDRDDLGRISNELKVLVQDLYDTYTEHEVKLNHYEVVKMKPYRQLRAFLEKIRKLTYLIHFAT